MIARFMQCVIRVVSGLLIATVAASAAAHDWPAYNKGYDGVRYSPLSRIDTGNAGSLKRVCEADLGDPGTFQTGPLVIGSTLYATTTHSTVALDAADCTVRWQHIYSPEENEVYRVNRGLAYLDGRLFRGTADGRLLAIDAKTGKEIWRVKAGNPKVGEYLSSAPIAWNGLVFIGTAGGDWAIKSRMFAFDAATGAQRWRFNIVPEPGEPGAETWQQKEGVVAGGGGTWTSYALDPQSGELFVPTANPSPTFRPEERPGDNLYTNSILVLDARTGHYKWHYQHRPNDPLDSGTTPPVLYKDAQGRSLVAFGTKHGYLYGLDRATRQIVFKVPITTVMDPQPLPTPEGVRVCPGFVGGMEWNSPALDPRRMVLYSGSVDLCNIAKTGKEKYVPGQLYHGTAALLSTDERDIQARGWIYATDASTGQVLWTFNAESPVVAALTPTAGGLLFAGTVDGEFWAIDARSGRIVFRRRADGALAGGIVTYEVKDRQYVAFASGNVSRGPFFALAGSPRITVLTTGLTEDAPRIVRMPRAVTEIAEENLLSEHYGTIVGQKIYLQMCATCHGAEGRGGVGAALRNVPRSDRKDQRSIEEIIKQPLNATMPKLYPQPLGEEEIRQILLFLKTWNAE